MKSTLIITFVVFLAAQFAWSGQIIIWEDEKGITHIEYHKSNTGKTSLSNPQKYRSPERQGKEYSRKIQQRKSALIRKSEEVRRKYEKKLHESRRSRNEQNALIRKSEELTKKYEKKLDESQKASSSGDAITQMCKNKWGNNYKMVKYCVKMQRKARRNLTGHVGTIRNNCEAKWGNNYQMIEHCLKTQKEAKWSVDHTIHDETYKSCADKWGQNYQMIDYCQKGQRAAKKNVERNYSGQKRRLCEAKWGNNYQMVEYCLNK